MGDGGAIRGPNTHREGARRLSCVLLDEIIIAVQRCQDGPEWAQMVLTDKVTCKYNMVKNNTRL